MCRKYDSMFFSRKKLREAGQRVSVGLSIRCFPVTHSNTRESCWSPQIRISAMQRSDSTSRPRLLSDTVVFFSKMLYRYLRCSSERRFLGRPPQGPPNQLRLRNMLDGATGRLESTGHAPPSCVHIPLLAIVRTCCYSESRPDYCDGP